MTNKLICLQWCHEPACERQLSRLGKWTFWIKRSYIYKHIPSFNLPSCFTLWHHFRSRPCLTCYVLEHVIMTRSPWSMNTLEDDIIDMSPTWNHSAWNNLRPSRRNVTFWDKFTKSTIVFNVRANSQQAKVKMIKRQAKRSKNKFRQI